MLLLLLLLVSAFGDVSLSSGLIGRATNFDRSLVAHLQSLANLMKGQELPPAGLDSAGARHTVAFTSSLYSSLYYLEQKQRITVNVYKTLKARKLCNLQTLCLISKTWRNRFMFTVISKRVEQSCF